MPLSLLIQWQNEIKKHVFDGKLDIYEYHDKRDREDPNLHSYDVVLTTYSLLGREFSYLQDKKKRYLANLYKYKWHRVILDESHIIKSKSNSCSRGAFMINAVNRWCLTGTPMHNKFDDLYSLINFLKVPTF